MIKIFDTTLRDGEQSPGFAMNIKQKIKDLADKKKHISNEDLILLSTEVLNNRDLKLRNRKE